MAGIRKSISVIFVFFFFVERRDESDCDILTKSTYTLLHALFMGIESKDEVCDQMFANTISVSYRYAFTSKQTSMADARNSTARKAIRALCEIDNKFTQHRHNEIFPQHFGQNIEK